MKPLSAFLFFPLAIAGCGSSNGNSDGNMPPGHDAAVLHDASQAGNPDATMVVLDASMALPDLSMVLVDASAPADLNPCPIWNPDGGADPNGAQCTLQDQTCTYDIAYCLCHDVWQCCVTKPPMKCPLTQPTPDAPCCDNFSTPICEYDCINGQAPDCKCKNNKWVCTISAC